jgi:hypothetical protein
MKIRLFLRKSEPERRVQDARRAQCPRRSYGSGEVAYFLRRLRRLGAAAAGAAAAAAFLRALRRFGAAAAFFAFFRAAMIHPLVDESVRRGRSLIRTLSPFFHAVKGMFRSLVADSKRERVTAMQNFGARRIEQRS